MNPERRLRCRRRVCRPGAVTDCLRTHKCTQLVTEIATGVLFRIRGNGDVCVTTRPRACNISVEMTRTTRKAGGYEGPQLSIVSETGELVPWNPHRRTIHVDDKAELFVEPQAPSPLAGALAVACTLMAASTRVFLLGL